MTTFKANRKFPNPITVNDDPRSHTLALQQVIEALNIGQRRTKEVGSSYVRVSELVDVGLIEIVGNQLKLTNLGTAVASGGGGGASALADLTDVDLTGLGDGYLLVWNAVSSMWEAIAGASAAGRHAVWISAGAMTPDSAAPCQQLALVASGSGYPDLLTLNFDPTTKESAQFSMMMPKSWNESGISFVPVWSHPATTTNFGVVWEVQAVAVGNGDTILASYGTAQSSSDTGGTTNTLYSGPESSAITVAGSPADEDVVFFKISRLVADGGDTMAVDARLHGVTVYINTDAETDA